MAGRAALLVFVIGAIVASIFYLQSQKVEVDNNTTEDTTIAAHDTNRDTGEKAKSFERAKEISSPDGFINTGGITIGELIGKKVVLVDFWTYSCINCQRTTPYLNAWYEKYRDMGLEIIGIHTPEFDFEKKYDNVQKAVEQFGIRYPVVLDNDYSTWNAYRNRYWPRKYLIDIDGFIVYDHIGEGGYEETERRIHDALSERMKRIGAGGTASFNVTRPDWVRESSASSPEVYFGAFRNDLLGNGERNVVGVQQMDAPGLIKPDTLYLVGEWDVQEEFARNTQAGAKIIFKYNASSINVVAGAEETSFLNILVDGKAEMANVGFDAGLIESYITVPVDAERLYNIASHGGKSEHTIEIIIEKPGVQFYTFTFG